jgi:uncharacterized membrane protein
MTQKTSGRLDAIDQYRGFAILLMALADYRVGVNIVPACSNSRQTSATLSST